MLLIATSLLLILLTECGSLYAAHCYVGVGRGIGTAEVGSQVCSFAIECMDSSCRKPPRVTFGKNDGKIYETSIDEGEGLCYTRHHAIICFCKSHLCNDEGFMENLLAEEYAKADSPLMGNILKAYVGHLIGDGSDTNDDDLIEDPSLVNMENQYTTSQGYGEEIESEDLDVVEKTTVKNLEENAKRWKTPKQQIKELKRQRTTRTRFKTSTKKWKPPVQPMKEPRNQRKPYAVPVRRKEDKDYLPAIIMMGAASFVVFIVGFAVILGITNLVSKRKMRKVKPQTAKEPKKRTRKTSTHGSSVVETYTTTGVSETSQFTE